MGNVVPRVILDTQGVTITDSNISMSVIVSPGVMRKGKVHLLVKQNTNILQVNPLDDRQIMPISNTLFIYIQHIHENIHNNTVYLVGKYIQ